MFVMLRHDPTVVTLPLSVVLTGVLSGCVENPADDPYTRRYAFGCK